MKIAVIGAGAMGSIYAGLLAENGNEVWAVDLWQDHISAIQKNGLQITGASGDRVVKTVNARTETGEIGICDLIIIATKANGVAAAAKAIKPLLGEHTLVLAMQNGLGAAERILDALPDANILLGVAQGFGAAMKGPAHVTHAAMAMIRIGELSGGMTDRLKRVNDVWQNAGFNTQADEDINKLIWEKFVCNCSFSAPCTVYNRKVGEMLADPHAWKVSVTCGTEAYLAGVAKGIKFGFDDPEAYIHAFGEKVANAYPSMTLDHQAKRKSEIDAINGIVPEIAAEVGTAAPFNEVLTAIVRSKEAEF